MRVASLTAVLAMMMTNAALAEPDWKAVGQALGKEGAASCPAASIGSACRAPT